MTDPKTHGARAPRDAHPQLIEATEGAPLLAEKPSTRAEQTDALGYVPPNGLWPLVIIAGRYGFLGCENMQTLRYRGILRSTALNEAKKWFGACPRVINYYDEQGRLISTE